MEQQLASILAKLAKLKILDEIKATALQQAADLRDCKTSFDLATPTHTTCSTDGRGLDTDEDGSVDVVPELAAPVVCDAGHGVVAIDTTGLAAPTPLTCSTKCSNQVGATSFPSPVTTASLLPAATRELVADLVCPATNAVDLMQPFRKHDLDVSPPTRHEGLLLWPTPWPSFWMDHAEGNEVRLIPWPSFLIGRFMEHLILFVQVHDSGWISSTFPMELSHVGNLVCDLPGNCIRILPGQLLCLWSLQQDDADSCLNTHVKLFHYSKQWFSEVCAFTEQGQLTFLISTEHDCGSEMICACAHPETNSKDFTIQSALPSSFEQLQWGIPWTLSFVRKTTDCRPCLRHNFQFLLPPGNPRAVQVWSDLHIVESSSARTYFGGSGTPMYMSVAANSERVHYLHVGLNSSDTTFLESLWRGFLAQGAIMPFLVIVVSYQSQLQQSARYKCQLSSSMFTKLYRNSYPASTDLTAVISARQHSFSWSSVELKAWPPPPICKHTNTILPGLGFKIEMCKHCSHGSVRSMKGFSEHLCYKWSDGEPMHVAVHPIKSTNRNKLMRTTSCLFCWDSRALMVHPSSSEFFLWEIAWSLCDECSIFNNMSIWFICECSAAVIWCTFFQGNVEFSGNIYLQIMVPCLSLELEFLLCTTGDAPSSNSQLSQWIIAWWFSSISAVLEDTACSDFGEVDNSISLLGLGSNTLYPIGTSHLATTKVSFRMLLLPPWDPGDCTNCWLDGVKLRSSSPWDPGDLHRPLECSTMTCYLVIAIKGLVFRSNYVLASHQVMLTGSSSSLLDGVEFSTGCGEALFQGGRSIMVLHAFVDHHYHLDAFLNRVIGYYLDGAYFFDLAQVYFDNVHHRDYGGTKEHRVSWDPGGKGMASAWGQAEFQGGRIVSDLAQAAAGLALDWGDGPGPYRKPGASAATNRRRAEARKLSGWITALAAGSLLPVSPSSTSGSSPDLFSCCPL